MAGRDPIPGLETRGWHARLLQIYRYWLSIHPPHGLPGRQHVDPTAIPALLAGLWLLDVQRAPFRLRYRLVGTNITSALGRELTGLWMDEAHSALRDKPDHLARYRDLLDSKAPSRKKGTPLFWYDSVYTMIENVILPLARDGVTVDMIMVHTVLYTSDGDEL